MNNEVDLMLRNAELRNELEPFMDESIQVVDLDKLPTDEENAYLSSLLAWERAPVLAIRDWFNPPLELEPHNSMDDETIHYRVEYLLQLLAEKNIFLDMTDHLSDRQLYCLIARDILPSREKLVDRSGNALRWQCLDPLSDEESWLRFYASDDERDEWFEETGLRLPPKEVPPFPRHMPCE
ncbi:MAG: hypothetical protein KF851_17515 [Pirellulaceae bacterium]|nr:hypothetical protein [Pirellulaceae bacterium]